MCWQCDEDRFRSEPVKKSVKVTLPDAEGMQYRTSVLGYWQDVNKGQTSFEVSTGRLEFRKKPKMVATITYPTNTAVFYDEESLKRAVEINLQNGSEFELKVEFK
ncbi:hypothetical protein PP459_gp029 [Streptomyces phage Wakanda]|uniref:Uncharacterized protein n=2 Tax=Wakandavirus TaxID=3044854 RepID=A0A6G8R3L8_9CAUD|nr:hypothetical protein PP459_gp029 [Streptomyces phage Wakanda]YP_010652527.1 hypothetical protein PP460_gp031 [Streptomyces phage Muntaha]QIN94204.1 hypothetical protein SEA_WAKANDA_244 [Streptomyces phage Wakanda]QIN94771.1 hypothetical protein SEA_MUNTAHA_248 [Streptomyces phage Muntaha]